MDRIDLLEAKVKEMIVLVHSLREENGRLRAELDERDNRLSSLSTERRVLDSERDTVRDRIEQLLGDLEALEAASAVAEARQEQHPEPPAQEHHEPESSAGVHHEPYHEREHHGEEAGESRTEPEQQSLADNPVLPGLT